MDTALGSTSAHFEELCINSDRDKGIECDPITVCEFEVSNKNNASMLSIPECGEVGRKTERRNGERSDLTDRRQSSDDWRNQSSGDCRNQSGDWDNDMVSVSSNRSYATCDTAATSESVQSIIQRLNSETDRRRRRLMRRRSKRKNESTTNEVKEPTSPRGFTVEVVERNF